MKLYIARHGEALGKEEDPARPLSEQGRRDVRAIAGLLGSAGVRVVRAWHSGKPRAKQTAEILARAMLPRGKVQAVDGLGPNAPVDEFIVDADVWEEDTLIVGHLPFMSRMLSAILLDDAQQELVDLSAGSVACLERVSERKWVLLWVLRPDLLDAAPAG